MTETEKMQQLHHRKTTGEKLSQNEETALQDWYNELDREEALILNRTAPLENHFEWREQLNKTLEEIARTAASVERIAKQNEVLRHENENLRRALESRLSEQTA